MSLRDQFAAAALTGILASRPYPQKDDDHGEGELNHIPDHILADWAYDLADAMMEARAMLLAEEDAVARFRTRDGA